MQDDGREGISHGLVCFVSLLSLIFTPVMIFPFLVLHASHHVLPLIYIPFLHVCASLHVHISNKSNLIDNASYVLGPTHPYPPQAIWSCFLLVLVLFPPLRLSYLEIYHTALVPLQYNPPTHRIHGMHAHKDFIHLSMRTYSSSTSRLFLCTFLLLFRATPWRVFL